MRVSVSVRLELELGFELWIGFGFGVRLRLRLGLTQPWALGGPGLHYSREEAGICSLKGTPRVTPDP